MSQPTHVEPPAALGRVDEPLTARTLLIAIAIGLAVAVAVVGVAYSILAIPFYTLAQAEPGSGLNRPVVRNGIFRIALPGSFIIGLATGAFFGGWYAKGGRLPSGHRSVSEL